MERITFLKSLIAMPAGVAAAASETVTFDKKLVAKLCIGDRRFTLIVTEEEANWINENWEAPLPADHPSQ